MITIHLPQESTQCRAGKKKSKSWNNRAFTFKRIWLCGILPAGFAAGYELQAVCLLPVQCLQSVKGNSNLLWGFYIQNRFRVLVQWWLKAQICLLSSEMPEEYKTTSALNILCTSCHPNLFFRKVVIYSHRFPSENYSFIAALLSVLGKCLLFSSRFLHGKLIGRVTAKHIQESWMCLK